MKWFRRVEQLVEDGIIEGGSSRTSVAAGNVVGDLRSPAVVEVLCKLPEECYATVKEQRIWFFAPAPGVDGWNSRIPQQKDQLIYLPPHLEQTGRQHCILVAAHEVAHSLLGHTDSPSTPQIEDEAWGKVVELGFGTRQEVEEFRSRLTEAAGNDETKS
jgi:hypothetical protein